MTRKKKTTSRKKASTKPTLKKNAEETPFPEVNQTLLFDTREALQREKPRLPLQERVKYEPDPEEEWEDEEITVSPAKPGEHIRYPTEDPNADPETTAPEPPPIRNQSEGDPPLTSTQQEAPVFVVAELLKDPTLYDDPMKIQRLVVNLSVLGYLTQERIAETLVKLENTLSLLLPTQTEIHQAIVLMLDTRLNELGRTLNESQMPSVQRNEPAELLPRQSEAGEVPDLL